MNSNVISQVRHNLGILRLRDLRQYAHCSVWRTRQSANHRFINRAHGWAVAPLWSMRRTLLPLRFVLVALATTLAVVLDKPGRPGQATYPEIISFKSDTAGDQRWGVNRTVLGNQGHRLSCDRVASGKRAPRTYSAHGRVTTEGHNDISTEREHYLFS